MEQQVNQSLRKVKVMTATPFVPPYVTMAVPVLTIQEALSLKPSEKIILRYQNPVDEDTLPLSSLCIYKRLIYNNPIIPFLEVEGTNFILTKDGEDLIMGDPPLLGEEKVADQLYLHILESLTDLKNKISQWYEGITPQHFELNMLGEISSVISLVNIPIEKRVLSLISYTFTHIYAPPFVRRPADQLFFAEMVNKFVSETEWSVEGILLSLKEIVDAAHIFHSTHFELVEKVEEEHKKQQKLMSLSIFKRVVEEDIQKLQGKTSAYGMEQLRSTFEKKKEDLPPEVREYIEENLEYIERSGGLMSVEGAFLSRHINYLLELPWNTVSEEEPLPLDEAERLLNDRFYGMRRVKERVLDLLSVMHRLNLPNLKGRILCFVGPPGVGKTALSLYLSDVLKRPLQKVHVGGISDETEIRGHRRTYVGATAGRIIEAIRRAKVKNPIIVLEEIDKVTHGGIKGDPIAALMEVLDPEQNHSFVDHYVDFPFDLSKVFFVATANDEDMIHPTLRDRMEIVYLRPYFIHEKIKIATDFLLPKICEDLKISPSSIKWRGNTMKWFIENYSFGGGVREIERSLRLVIERHLRRNPDKPLTPQFIKEYMMSPPYVRLRKLDKPEVGVAPLLVVYGSGEGGVEFVQISKPSLKERKQHVLTGNLRDVPKEVVEVCLTLLQRYNIDVGNEVVHVHQTSMGLPKSGPSGGLSTFSALYSYYTKEPLPTDWAFTGEVDLLGNVHPVGGIAAKLVAAEQSGFTTVVLPAANKDDVKLMDFKVRLKIYYVKHTDEVVKLLKQGVKR